MDNEKEKVKRYHVTHSLRFPSPIVKGLYYASIVMIAGAVVTLAFCLITGTRGTAMGLAAVVGMLGIIWMVASHFISENTYGLTTISFGEEYMMFYFGEDKFRLRWDKVVECGIEKTRRSYWVYASDHKLSEAEKKEFPQNVKDGVFYFDHYWNSWDEFMKFVPEQFREDLAARKAELGIKDKGRK